VFSLTDSRTVYLYPHWAKEEKTGYKMINARVETLAQWPAFRSLLAGHRCMIPTTGYYEFMWIRSATR
jgi:putative SOS response-associated peptidase YedK